MKWLSPPSSPSSRLVGAALVAAVVKFSALSTPPSASLGVKIDHSLASVPLGAIKARIESIYPEDLDGGYAELPLGLVRYNFVGPVDGRRVVMIHGYSLPSVIFKGVATHLASSGYRVLLYDLYGRGYSDAPRVTNDLNLFTTQLALLFQYVGWTKARVVGLSMGGGIAVGFSQAFPHLVDGHVALLASAGLLPLGRVG